MATSFLTSASGNPCNSLGRKVFLGTLLCLSLLAMAQVQALDLLKPFSRLFGHDKGVVIWKGPGQFVKIVDQDWDYDHRHAPENNQPVQFSPADLAVVLASIRAQDPEGGAIVPVFTQEEIRMLSEKLSVALERSQPDKDVVFGVVGNYPNLASSGLRSTGCRVFFHAGALNMIFGDILRPTDSFSGDTSQYSKPHRAGRRMESNGREIRVARGPGIDYWQGRGFMRPDWIRIDVPAVIAANRRPGTPYEARTAYETMPQAQSVAETDYSPTAENHRLREQLARAKKRMAEEQQNNVSGSSGDASAPAVDTAAPEYSTGGGEAATSQQASPVANGSLSAENRRLREQLARARKAQQQQNTAAPAATRTASAGSRNTGANREIRGNSPTAAGTSDEGIVQRLTTLKTLYVKKLITKDEYDAKRKEILKQF